MSVRPIHVLELRSVRGTGGGPEKTILRGAAYADSSEVRVTVCYIRDRRDDAFTIDRRAEAMGVAYVEVLERHSFDLSVVPALRDVIRQRKIDILHAHDYKTNLLAWLLARLEPVAALTTAHGWSGTSLRERIYYWLDRRLIAGFPIAIAVSEAIRQRLIAEGADPGAVRRIPNAIDSEEFRPDAAVRARMRRELGVPPGALVVGTIGRLEPIKRHDLLLTAIAGLRGEPFIVLAGNGSCRPALVAQARDLGLEGRLLLLGHRDDPRDVHQALDVYVQASDSEGLPNAVLEAMAVGTPVVATDVGGTAELIRHRVDGLLVAAGDREGLRRALEDTIADRGAAWQRSREARARIVREWSFERRMETVNAIYRELYDTHRGRRIVAEQYA
jgi:glycosyltransferase involved in cell wall biosynthesis